ANVAPKAVPGNYQVRLTVGGETFTQSFAILPDPRLPVSEADLKAQFDLKLAIRDKLSETNETLNQIQRVRSQVEEWEKRVKNTEHAARIASAGKTLRDQLRTIEGALINLDADKPQPGVSKIKEKLGALSTMIDESDHAPTKGAGEVYAMLNDQLDEQRKQLQQLLDEHIPSFGDLVQSLAIPPIVA
ncbi:MAG: glycosyl hydrolase, partial [Chloroflexota bacterium]|nr:glycosyl hydrolase [Chloroflexota bacterium]